MKRPNVDWNRLKDLREKFLSHTDLVDYWEDPDLLQDYENTFAQRIGWKWEAVLSELKAIGWNPPEDTQTLDWGCGTGIASRKFHAVWPVKHANLWDRSDEAREFSKEIFLEQFPDTSVGSDKEGNTLLVSHCISELPPKELDSLVEMVRKSAATIWVESGSAKHSRSLIEVRERLKDELSIVAPCTHQKACGLLENARDWCHHFAKPPVDSFQSAFWSEFSKRLGIDLRSLPVSYLVMQRSPWTPPSQDARLIGKVRKDKGRARVLACEAGGVKERQILKRHAGRELRRLGSWRVLLSDQNKLTILDT